VLGQIKLIFIEGL